MDYLLEKVDTVFDNTNSIEINHVMKSEQGELFVAELISMIDNGENIDKSTEAVIKVLVKLANYIYSYTEEESFMSDSDYDKLYEYYKETTNDESFTIADSSNKVAHKYVTLRGTLNKVYKLTDEDVIKNKSQKSIEDWVAQTERLYKNKTGNNINLLDEDVTVFPKFDGVSAIYEFEPKTYAVRVLTRGDTERNLASDVTPVLGKLYKPSWADAFTLPFGVKTEIMMSEDDLIEYNETYHTNYKNSRSIVASIINSKELDDRVDYLKPIPLRYSYGEGYDGLLPDQEICPDAFDYPYLECKLKEFDKIREFAYNNKYVYGKYRCDGAVIVIKDPVIRHVLGRENNKQLSEVAFKFTEETAYSEVVDIEFSTGLFGRITPVVKFKPVKMKGNTVENASLGSYSRYVDMELCKGDIIKVIYDIIPYVMYDKDDPRCKRSGEPVIEAPSICPDCGSILVTNGEILQCINKSCPCRVKGRILNFCKKMNIKNISYAIIDTLYKEGILTDIKSLFSLDDRRDEITKLDGFGDLKVNSFVDEINKISEIPASIVLGALGIEGVATKTFKSVLKYIHLDELLDICKDGNNDVLEVVPGVKSKTSAKIIDGIRESMPDIKYLMDVFNIVDDSNTKSDFTVVFTKFRDESLEDFIRDNGGEVVDSLTKTTDILVVPNEFTSSGKVDKAKKNGTAIVPKDKLKDYITEKYL